MAMISVALCTYNGEKHIGEQIESILAQSRLPDEIVLSDDASADGTAAVAQRSLRSFKGRLLFKQNRQNLGFRKNFQQALKLCTGDIICLSDQDDVWEPAKIEKLAQALAEHPQAQMAFHDASLVDGELKLLYPSFWATMTRPAFIPEEFLQGNYSRLFFGNVVQGAACAVRRELVEMASPFPDEAVHDQWLALVAAACGGVVPVQAQLLKYRQESNAIGGLPLGPYARLVKWTRGLPQATSKHVQGLQGHHRLLEIYARLYADKLAPANRTALEHVLQWAHLRDGCLSGSPGHVLLRGGQYWQALGLRGLNEWLKDLLAAICRDSA